MTVSASSDSERSGTVTIAGKPFSITQSTDESHQPHDFNGDGMADILLHDTADSGMLWYVEMDGGSIASGDSITDTDWDVAGVADFGGDGKADILLKNPDDRMLYLNEMDG